MSNETNAVMTNDDEHWDLVLQPKNKLLDLKIRELIRYRDLVLLFIKRDFTTAYKQTVLGPLWYVVQPLITTVMYTFIFGNLAGIGSDGIPTLLFYYTGTSLWTYFTGCLNSASGVFTSNSGIFGKVYFPRLTVPISTTVGNMIKLGIQFAMLMIFYIYYLIIKAPIQPSWWALGLPLIVIWIGAMGTGLGMIISSLTTKYRDLNQLLSFGLSLAMYATPVAYPLSEAATRMPSLAWILNINPMSAPIELCRKWFFGSNTILPAWMILLSVGLTALFLFVGLILFNRNERTFVDVI